MPQALFARLIVEIGAGPRDLQSEAICGRRHRM